MKIHGTETNETLLIELGERLKRHRIALGVSQEELSSISGVSVRTIINIEKGKNASLAVLISLLKGLGLAANLDLLIPESKTDPFDVFKLGHRRQRVSRKEAKANPEWKWGDEQ